MKASRKDALILSLNFFPLRALPAVAAFSGYGAARGFARE
jgi:hypothetical protein